MTLSNHSKGLLFAFLGVLAFTPDTVLVRLINTDPWTMISLRAGLMALALAVCVLFTWKGQLNDLLRQFRGTEFVFAIIFAITMFFFILSLNFTTAANVLVFISISPLFATLFSWVFLKEKAKPHTLVAILGCVVGALVVFAGEYSSTQAPVTEFSYIGPIYIEDEHRGLVGCFFALLTSVLIGANMVVRRSSQLNDTMPALVVGGIFASLMSLPFASLETGKPLVS